MQRESEEGDAGTGEVQLKQPLGLGRGMTLVTLKPWGEPQGQRGMTLAKLKPWREPQGQNESEAETTGMMARKEKRRGRNATQASEAGGRHRAGNKRVGRR